MCRYLWPMAPAVSDKSSSVNGWQAKPSVSFLKSLRRLRWGSWLSPPLNYESISAISFGVGGHLELQMTSKWNTKTSPPLKLHSFTINLANWLSLSPIWNRRSSHPPMPRNSWPSCLWDLLPDMLGLHHHPLDWTSKSDVKTHEMTGWDSKKTQGVATPKAVGVI